MFLNGRRIRGCRKSGQKHVKRSQGRKERERLPKKEVNNERSKHIKRQNKLRRERER